MRIGELAARAEVSVRSVRYYEEQGLLTSTRSASGQRLFEAEDVERVRFLQRLYAAGLSSRTILEVLPCVTTPDSRTADDAWVRLTEERARLDERIDELVRTREALDEVIAVNRRARRRLRRETARDS